ncbi:hypothetical protein L6164_028459 [Bauhinia variegata]|uniref:Uncharacterized protein n=1 Tax=Bauhinia variegata TaxID=167791 RepID=A0ACB9L688_BAUVA|nr:hypothetical protein L6164_028459 [Bauhinia variegata]
MATNSELGFDVPEGVPVTDATSDETTSPVTFVRPRTVHELDDVGATYTPGVLDMDDLRSDKAPTTSDLKEAWDSLFGTSGATNGFDIKASPLGVGVSEGKYGDRFFTWNLYYSYRCGVSLPFNNFEMKILRTLDIAPTQLHPNAWATLYAFQKICRELNRPPRIDVFFYFYCLRNPKKREVGYLYFSAKRGRSLILLAEDFAKQFKQWFFRVVEPDVGRLFFIDDNGKAKFPLRWRKNFKRVEEITTADLGHAALYLVKELEARVYSDPAKAFYRAARYIDRKTMPNLKALLARTGCDLSGVPKKRKVSASSARPEVEGPVVDIPPMMGDPNLNEGGDLHFATEPMMGEENLPEGGDLPFAVEPQERVNPLIGGARTASVSRLQHPCGWCVISDNKIRLIRAQGRSDTGLNPENLLQEYEHVQSTVMLSQVANSFANQMLLIKEQTGGLRRSLNMIQIVHDRIKSDQHASIKADEMCAMKEAAEEKITVTDKRIAALEAELASAKGIAVDAEIKSVEEKASRAVS